MCPPIMAGQYEIWAWSGTVLAGVVQVQIWGALFVGLHAPMIPLSTGQSVSPLHANIVVQSGTHSRVAVAPLMD